MGSRAVELIGEVLDAVTPILVATHGTPSADRGLAGFPLVKLCRNRKWHALLWVCKEQTCRRGTSRRLERWTALGQIILKEGKPLGQLWLLDILRRARNQASLTRCLPCQKTAKGW
jgi:hypothetical protein